MGNAGFISSTVPRRQEKGQRRMADYVSQAKLVMVVPFRFIGALTIRIGFWGVDYTIIRNPSEPYSNY